MILSLELCKELKAAGAPQDKTEWIWIIFPDPPIGTGGARQVLGANWDFRRGNEWVADWNSDELIAQIQAEKLSSEDINGPIFGWQGGWQIYNYDTDDVSPQTLACGDTLAEALARLYIALKAQA